MKICSIVVCLVLGILCCEAQYSPPSGGGGGGGSVASVFGRTGTVAAATADYTAAQVTNAADTSSAYSNPGWITALANAKVTGLTAFATLSTGTSAQFVRADGTVQALNLAALSDGLHAIVDSSTYSNPAWITALANAKVTGLTGFATLATGATSTYVRGDASTQTLNCAALSNSGTGCTATLATVATSGSAADLGTGTLPSGRLPAYSAYTTVSFSATPTFTVTTRSSVQNFEITLTNNVTSSTLTTTNATSGQDIAFKICQDATGSRTFVWPTNVVNPGSIPTTASTCGKQVFRFDGSNAVAFGPMVSDSAMPGFQTSTGFQALPSGSGTLSNLPGIAGYATFSSTGGTIASVSTSGIVTGVTRSGAGLYTVALSSSINSAVHPWLAISNCTNCYTRLGSGLATASSILIAVQSGTGFVECDSCFVVIF